ncbi:DUF4097 family beta strand repeat-containing protein [Salsipaludibacter albus]|uniref:DUF4097 family beta strand repeat-containing protein n=1 Tax=Salsipaludibacter albus TaxID=2849650 RepID=UPI001EE4E271|nr:DUF4097 family beta strand repeat-containing protein [Salsipaludibacter albus]MBY5162450.1 DUF4097 family beta strand repeat protein [Salsipaludibacter albus]
MTTTQEHVLMTTFDTTGPVRARIDLGLGALHLHAGQSTTTTVEVRPSDPSEPDDVDAAARTTVELDGDQLVVRGPDRQGLPLVRSWVRRGWGGSIDVTIDLPEGSALELSAGSGDVDATGRLGNCRIRTGLGSIRLEATDALDCKSGAGGIMVDRVTGGADVTTASGRVELASVTGDAVVRNSNGATRLGRVDGHLRVKAANGPIEVGVATGSIVAKSANGDVVVDEVASGNVVLETHVGDVEVGIPVGTAAWLDLDATAGTVRNDLAAADAPTEDGARVEVRARTTLGQVLVRRPRAVDHA